MDSKKKIFGSLSGDFNGGLGAMLVALPSTIAYGLMSFAPLINVVPVETIVHFSSMAAVGAILGTVAFSLIVPLFGGTVGLISGPSAAVATVMSVFVGDLVRRGSVSIEIIPIYVTFLTIFSSLIQLLIGNFGGGKFIKYIPYPVITGYLKGVSILLLLGQLPKFFGLTKNAGLMEFSQYKWQSMVIGSVTMLAMFFSSKIIKKFPPAIIGLSAGIITYFLIALTNHELFSLSNNPFVIGKISVTPQDMVEIVSKRWFFINKIDPSILVSVLVPGITLSLLLCVSTLNTCIVLDGITYSNHNPKKELLIQGCGNFVSGLFGGIPCSGLLTSTMENINGGAKSQKSVLFFGINTLIVLLIFGKLLAWIPLAALAGILIVVAIGLIDFRILSMLKNKSTVFDFIVILVVIVAAVYFGLIKAAGVGIAMAIFLFLREQMGTSVIRRKVFGNQVFSKKIRIANERAVLEKKGETTIIIELQGQLFFGTTDQLFSKLESYYATCSYIVLDMRRIQSVDYTAANMLKKIFARVKEKKGILIFSNIPEKSPSGQNIKEYLTDLDIDEKDNLKIFDDLDAALVWIEDEILTAEHVSYDSDKVLELNELEFFIGFPEDALQTLHSCMETRSYKPNEIIFKGGDKGDEIFFVRKGNVKIVLTLSDGKHYHLLTIGMGGILGEMAFIDKITRSADALSVDNTNLYVLSREKFNKVTEKYPEISGMLFERLALLIANRLRQSNKELKVFQES